jgi:hypothetical protein
MKARKRGGDPKRSPDIQPMKPKDPKLSNLRANEKEDREAAVRKAVTMGQSPLQARETNKSFNDARIKASAPFVSSVKPDASDRSISKLRDYEEMKIKKTPSTSFSKPKARYQDGGKVPKAQKKEDKEVAKSVAGSRYVGTGDKAMNYDANSLKKAQQATDKLVDLDMRAIKKRLSEEEKSSMKSTRDSLRSLINENIVGPDAAVMYGQTKKRWQMKND